MLGPPPWDSPPWARGPEGLQPHVLACESAHRAEPWEGQEGRAAVAQGSLPPYASPLPPGQVLSCVIAAQLTVT